MHSHSLDRWRHQHVFLGEKHERHERRTWAVVALTAVTMVAEIVGGTMFGSMALVADGWHMSTHAVALAIAALAYRFARTRTHAHDPRFSFGTGKLGELSAFASAIILAMIALFIGYESVTRLLAPVTIGFSQALPIAVVGLAVNLLSVLLLHDHGHGHGHADHDHGGHGHHDKGHSHCEDDHHGSDRDTNIRAAYVHVLADALTSILAIVALLAGRYYGWVWLDPVMGIVGTVVIAAWSWSLIRSAGAVLLDMVPDGGLADAIRHRLETGGDRVSDLHLWSLGPGHAGLIVSVISDHPEAPETYKARLAGIDGLSHVTVEVHGCQEHGPMQLAA